MANVRRALLLIALSAPPAGAAPAPADSARVFVESLYRADGRGDSDYLGRRAGEVFAPRLLDLIRRDQAATQPGDAPDLDWDPVCDCQDTHGLRAEQVEIEAAGPGRARATVRLRFAYDSALVRLDLARGTGGWRIADIRTRATPSLVARLEASVRPPPVRPSPARPGPR